MRLGVAFWSGISPQQMEDTLERLKDIGVKGLGHLNVENGWSDTDLKEFREGFAARGFFIGELTMYQYGGVLASEDKGVQDSAVESLARGFEQALILNAHCVGVSTIFDGPQGGINPWSDEVWEHLVEGTGKAAVEAERIGVDLAFHPGNRGPLDTPDQQRRLIDEVGSARVKAILDPVNMTDHRNYHSNADFLNYCFDLLGNDIVAAHAKDIYLDDSHWVTKLDEVPLVKGNTHYETYVRRLDELDDDLVFSIEHYRDVGVCGTVASPVYVDYPQTDGENTRARQYIHEVVQEVGVEIH